MSDDKVKIDISKIEAKPSCASELQSLDSSFWQASRGAPPLYVLIGIWIVFGLFALDAGFIALLLLSVALMSIGVAIGAVGQYESGWNSFNVFAVVCGAIFGVWVSILFLRPAIKATRLYFLAPSMDDEYDEIALPRERRETEEP